MTDEYRQALVALENARSNYEQVDIEYEGVAYHELKLAEERVMAIIRERRVEQWQIMKKSKKWVWKSYQSFYIYIYQKKV